VRAFCTYFDSRYLTRGLALWESLTRHLGEVDLYTLCLDDAAYDALTALKLPGIHPLRLDDIEQGDDRLVAAKATRSKIEYYFTLSPMLPLYILRTNPGVDSVTYLDADLYFFGPIEPLFEELGGRSVAIIEHRFPPKLQDRLQYGKYNVGCLIFRNDPRGREVLDWWRERCLEWCYDRVEAERFADQKYLDRWLALFDVAVLQHRGANVAPWNLAGSRLEERGGDVIVDGDPLLFYHFHNLKRWSTSVWQIGVVSYGVRPTSILRDRLYRPYIAAMNRWSEKLRDLNLTAGGGTVRRAGRITLTDTLRAPLLLARRELLIQRP